MAAQPATATKRGLLFELVIVAVIFLASNLHSALRQKQNTYHGGTAWETPYYTLAQEFMDHEPLATEGPYVFRIGTPWVVAQISPHELFRGFRIVNITGNAIACGLLVLWLRGYVADWRIRVLFVAIFVSQWDAPPRLVYHSPVHVDAWLFAFCLAGLLVVQRYLVRPSMGAVAALSVLAIGGVLDREATLMVPLCLLAAHRPFVMENGRWRFRLPPWRAWIPFACGFATFVAIHRFAHQTDDYSFWQTIYFFLYNKPVLTYLHAWFLAFGPVLFIVIYDWKNVKAYLCEEQWLALYLAVGVFLGFFGGTDQERLQYWSMPGVYLLLGRAIERHRGVLASWPLIATFAAAQILSTRVLWTTPDYPTDFHHTFPLFQQVGDNVQILDLFSYHGYRPKETLSLFEFLIFGVLVLWWMTNRARRLEATFPRPEATGDKTI
jgi:hypothetical protein